MKRLVVLFLLVFALDVCAQQDSCKIILFDRSWGESGDLYFFKDGELVNYLYHDNWGSAQPDTITLPKGRIEVFWNGSIDDIFTFQSIVGEGVGQMVVADYDWDNRYQLSLGLPLPATNLAAMGNNDELTVSLSWNNPVFEYCSESVSILDSVVVLRDGIKVASFSNQDVGQAMTFVDHVPGIHAYEYSVYSVCRWGRGNVVKATAVVGDLCQVRYELIPVNDYWEFENQLIITDNESFFDTVVWNMNDNPQSEGYLYIPHKNLKYIWSGRQYRVNLYSSLGHLFLTYPETPDLWYYQAYTYDSTNACDTPNPPTFVSVSSDEVAMEIAFSWMNPTTTIFGESLTSIDSSVIERNGQVIDRFGVSSSGQSFSYVDHLPFEYNYIYKVTIFSNGNESVLYYDTITLGNPCTITITGEGIHHWDGSKLKLSCNGVLFDSVSLFQFGTPSVTLFVPPREINFDWCYGESPNWDFGFTLSNSVGTVIKHCANSEIHSGSLFTISPCNAPQPPSDFVVAGRSEENIAILTWTNPSTSYMFDTLTSIDSVYVMRDNDLVAILGPLDPGGSMCYLDTVPLGKEYIYSLQFFSNGHASIPVSDTAVIGRTCLYKLVLWCAWQSSSVKISFSSNGYELKEFDFCTDTIWVNLPLGWNTLSVNIPPWYEDSHSVKLYDQENNLILNTDEGFVDSFLWYNACDGSAPESVDLLKVYSMGNVNLLRWRYPNVTLMGDTLLGISKLAISRNGIVIDSIRNPMPNSIGHYCDTLLVSGTYNYTLQCYYGSVGGATSQCQSIVGEEIVLFDKANDGVFVDTISSFTLSNDSFYTASGKAVIKISNDNPAKMYLLSGSASLKPDEEITIYNSVDEDALVVKRIMGSDSLHITLASGSVRIEIQTSKGLASEFSFRCESVNTLFEQPDTAIQIHADSNGIIYVTQQGSGLRDGSSWENATPWLSRAISYQDTNDQVAVVWVSQGVYYGLDTTFITDEQYYKCGYHVTRPIIGGFEGWEPADYDLSLRDYVRHRTIIDGGQYHICAVLSAPVDGISFIHGTDGVVCYFGSNITNSVIRGNLGTGLYNWHTFLDLSNVEIFENEVRGVYGFFGAMHGCHIHNNLGNGVECGGTNATFLFENSIFTNNDGCGVRVNSAANYVNCIFANNLGSGVCNPWAYDQLFANTIIHNNGTPQVEKTIQPDVRFVNCAVQEQLYCSTNNIYLSGGSSSECPEPGFVSPTQGRGSSFYGGDWHLNCASICIDRGTDQISGVGMPKYDFDGAARVQNNRCDIGPFESSFTLAPAHGFIRPDSNGIIYVTENGNGDGSSWQQSTPDLHAALQDAWLYGPDVQIWVAQGNYSTIGKPFPIKEGIKLYGGFVGNESADYNVNLRQTLAHPSILDGGGSTRVLSQDFKCEDSSMALIDGFAITNGYAESASAAKLLNNVILSNCHIYKNKTDSTNAVVESHYSTIQQCIVDNNDGSGIASFFSDVVQSTVVNNSGLGIYFTSEDRGDVFTSVESMDYLLDDLTQQNMAQNNIVWGNTTRNVTYNSARAHSSVLVSHCAIGGFEDSKNGNKNLSVSNNAIMGPHFVDDSLGDWRLDSMSACVNSGLGSSIAYDINGNVRSSHGACDMGAIESGFAAKRIVIEFRKVCIDEDASYFFFDDSISAPGRYEHKWDAGTCDSVVVLELSKRHVIFVTEHGSGIRNGSSWDNALSGNSQLVDSLEAATKGTEFWIQSGTYKPSLSFDSQRTFLLKSGVSIFGGFIGNESAVSDRGGTAAPSIFSGELGNGIYASTIFTTSMDNCLEDDIVLDNIMIANGSNSNTKATAIEVNCTSNILVNKCKIVHNIGSPAIVNYGNVNLVECLIDSNMAFSTMPCINFWEYYCSDLGAAALLNYPSGLVRICRSSICHNSSPTIGAIANFGHIEIDSSEMMFNRAMTGSFGAVLNGGVLSIRNSLIRGNRSYSNCSAIHSEGHLSLYNCLVDSNRSQMVYFEEYASCPECGYVLFGGGPTSTITIEGLGSVKKCVFVDNDQSTQLGGALRVGGSVAIDSSFFIRNRGSRWQMELRGQIVDDGWSDGQGSSDATLGVRGGLTGASGAGVCVSSGTCSISNSFFDGNRSLCGSSVSNSGGKLHVTESRFFGGKGGSCVFGIRGGSTVVDNSIVVNNNDGAVYFYNDKPDVTFNNVTFANNAGPMFFSRQSQYGGSDTPSDIAAPILNNCIVSDFSQLIDVLGLDEVFPIVTPCFNHSLINEVDGTEAIMKSSVMQVDKFPFVMGEGTGVVRLSDLKNECDTPTEGLSYRLVYPEKEKHVMTKLSAATKHRDSNCCPDSLGNMYNCDPLFVAPTESKGSDSSMSYLNANYRLRKSSPCIDRGDTIGIGRQIASYDLDHGYRIINGRIDIGAFEYGNNIDTIYIRDTVIDCQMFEVRVVSNDVLLGECVGSGFFPLGAAVEILAIPTNNAKFEQWSDGEKNNPRTITVRENTTISAIFLRKR